MDLREPAPIPAVLDLIRFLASSITFMAHLREVSVYFDENRLVRLTRDAGISKQLAIPQGLSPTSPMGFMNVQVLKSTRKWFIDNQAWSVLTMVVISSLVHYCGSHELGL